LLVGLGSVPWLGVGIPPVEDKVAAELTVESLVSGVEAGESCVVWLVEASVAIVVNAGIVPLLGTTVD